MLTFFEPGFFAATWNDLWPCWLILATGLGCLLTGASLRIFKGGGKAND